MPRLHLGAAALMYEQKEGSNDEASFGVISSHRVNEADPLDQRGERPPPYLGGYI